MPTKSLLKLGKISAGSEGGFKVFSGGTPSSGGETGFIRVNATFTNGSTNVTVNSDNSGYYPRTYIRVGQIVRATSVGFTDNQTIITAVASGGNSFTVAQAPNTDTSKTAVIKPGKTQAFVQSGSLSTPTGYPVWRYNDVTGSNDSEYQTTEKKWAILTQMALTSSRGSNVQSVYGVYEIVEFTNRISNTLASYFITSSNTLPEPEAFTPFSTGTTLGITELSPTSSIPQLFNGGDIGVLEGLGFAGEQDQVLSFLDKFTTGSGTGDAFPFTGSAVITGSLTISGDAGEQDFFLVRSSSFTSFKISSSNVPVFGAFTTTPTAIGGGFMYSASNFYAGID